VDGWVLPDDVHTLFAEKKHNNVPVLVGSNANEMTSLMPAASLPKTMDDYRRRIEGQYRDLAAEFDSVYGVKGEADIADAMLASGRDTIFSLQMRTWARMTTAAGSSAYLYFFSHQPPSPKQGELRAFHASEIPYVFNVLTFGDPRESGFKWTEADHRLSDQMLTYWSSFVATGVPAGKGLLKWPVYDATNEPYLELNDPLRVGNHLLKAQLDFQEKVLSRQR
jgi:para-nitrobenzyl esterase